MKWSKIQLQKFKYSGVEINDILDLRYLMERDSQIRSISPINVKGKADITSSKVTFNLQIEGELVLPSSRTLRDVHFALNIQAKETFLFEEYEFEEDGLEDYHELIGDVVDLKPVIEELILLEIPMQVYSEEDENIPSSQTAGKDWEYVQSEEQIHKDKIDPRLAKLAQLLDKNQD